MTETSEELPTYVEHGLHRAEIRAAQMELATEHSYAVTHVGHGRYHITPSRVVSAGSAAIDAFKEQP